MHQQRIAVSSGKVDPFQWRNFEVSTDAKERRVRTQKGTIRVGHTTIQSARRAPGYGVQMCRYLILASREEQPIVTLSKWRKSRKYRALALPVVNHADRTFQHKKHIPRRARPWRLRSLKKAGGFSQLGTNETDARPFPLLPLFGHPAVRTSSRMIRGHRESTVTAWISACKALFTNS